MAPRGSGNTARSSETLRKVTEEKNQSQRNTVYVKTIFREKRDIFEKKRFFAKTFFPEIRLFKIFLSKHFYVKKEAVEKANFCQNLFP